LEREEYQVQIDCDDNFFTFTYTLIAIIDTSRALFSRTLNIVCTLLIGNWKNDTHILLAALETLSSLAIVKLDPGLEYEAHKKECKIAIKWICDFIVYQCSRPPPHHSKDMHSTIVAAYQCLTVWFHEHSYLLQDPDCVNTMLEVIELGISGSKSRTNNNVVLKLNKELKPASLRVREAAETLLYRLMNHFGHSPSAPCPPQTIIGSCFFDECSILQKLHQSTGDQINLELASKSFKYFCGENAILLAFYNCPSSQRSICLIRSSFGKYCWSMKFQSLPFKKSNHHVNEIVARPMPNPMAPCRKNCSPRYFPEFIDKIPLVKM